jgi:hypothetical protein
MALWYILLDLFDNDFIWQSPLVNAAAITKTVLLADPRRADPESRTIFGIFEKLQLFFEFLTGGNKSDFRKPSQPPRETGSRSVGWTWEGDTMIASRNFRGESRAGSGPAAMNAFIGHYL